MPHEFSSVSWPPGATTSGSTTRLRRFLPQWLRGRHAVPAPGAARTTRRRGPRARRVRHPPAHRPSLGASAWLQRVGARCPQCRRSCIESCRRPMGACARARPRLPVNVSWPLLADDSRLLLLATSPERSSPSKSSASLACVLAFMAAHFAIISAPTCDSAQPAQIWPNTAKFSAIPFRFGRTCPKTCTMYLAKLAPNLVHPAPTSDLSWPEVGRACPK